MCALQWKQSLNAPVKPGDEVGVIVPVALDVAGILLLAGLMGYGASTNPPSVGGPLTVLIVLGAGIFVAVNLLAPLGEGLITAIRQMRARKK